VREYQEAGFGAGDAFDAQVDVGPERVTVACERVVKVPFGHLFGLGDGVERSTVSTAQARLRP
jgi:hypothetical protein